MKIVFFGIFVVVAILGVVVVMHIAQLSPFVQNSKNTQSVQTPDPKKTATLSFSPSEISNLSSKSATVDIIVDSGNNEVSGAQVELKYNPSLIENITIESPQNSFFGTETNYRVLFNEITQSMGRVSFAVAINPDGVASSGKGPIARLTVTPISPNISTQISFAPTTLVTTPGSRKTILLTSQNLVLRSFIPPVIQPLNSSSSPLLVPVN